MDLITQETSMHINHDLVHYSLKKEDATLCFQEFKGSLQEIQNFRGSFGYQCYTFGKAHLTSVQWKTIRTAEHNNIRRNVV